jgi:hypothetical protein
MYLSFSTILIIVALILLPLAVVYYNRQQNQKNNTVKDPRRGLKPNATNYNIDGIFSEEDLENATPEEIREIIRKVDRGDITSLSNDDFFRLKEKLNQSS